MAIIPADDGPKKPWTSKEKLEVDLYNAQRRNENSSIPFIGKSLLDQKLDEAQLKNLVNQGKVSPDVLGQEDPTVDMVSTSLAAPEVAPAQATEFVNPAQAAPIESNPASSQFSGGGLDPLATYKQGAAIEANAIANQGAQEAQALQGVQQKVAGIDNQINEDVSQEEKLTDEFNKQDEETANQIKSFKLQPKNFFAGKSTWQKILGGVGLFLGSITPEGARNVASIIDKEIDRDLEVQKNQLALMKDSQSDATKRYEAKLKQLGSKKLAHMSMKSDALSMVKLNLEQIAASAKGEIARGAAMKGIAAIEQGQQTLRASMIKEYMKANKDNQKGMLNGYEGVNENPAIVKDLTERVTAKDSAFIKIQKLENLLKEGALYGKNAEMAKQLRMDLGADIAKAKFGRSSDSELGMSMELIPDITSMMQRGSVDKALFQNLKQTIAQDVDVAAKAAGFRKPTVQGARKR